MRKAVVYALGGQLGPSKESLDELLTARLEKCSQYSRSIMTVNQDLYKSGAHYGTVSINDFFKR